MEPSSIKDAPCVPEPFWRSGLAQGPLQADRLHDEEEKPRDTAMQRHQKQGESPPETYFSATRPELTWSNLEISLKYINIIFIDKLKFIINI